MPVVFQFLADDIMVDLFKPMLDYFEESIMPKIFSRLQEHIRPMVRERAKVAISMNKARQYNGYRAKLQNALLISKETKILQFNKT